ncbi:hypothetical protein D3C75_1272850 [compost metagenome]
MKSFGIALHAAKQGHHGMIHNDRRKPAVRGYQFLDHIMRGKQQQIEILFLITGILREVDA